MVTNYVPHAPDSKISGRIINIFGGLAEAGPESIVSINRGSADGLEIGHVLSINRYGRVITDPEFDKKKPSSNTTNLKLEPGMVKLPDERVGLLMLFRVFEHVSYALVMQASQPIHKLDAVNTP